MRWPVNDFDCVPSLDQSRCDHLEVRTRTSILGELFNPLWLEENSAEGATWDSWSSYLEHNIGADPPLLTNDCCVHINAASRQIFAERPVCEIALLDLLPAI